MNAGTHHDVAIVGYGPVGTMIALLLQRLGLSVVIVERDTELCPFPRAAHFDDEIIRALQSVDLAHLIDDMEPPNVYEYFDKDWNKFLSRVFPKGQSDQGYAHDYMFFQPDVEAAMRATLLAAPNPPTLLTGHEVLSIADTGSEVALTVRDLATDDESTLHASYVIGADGARSLVRKAMGSEYVEISPSNSWYIVDVRLTADADPGWDQWEWCHPERCVTLVPLCGPYRRFEFDVKEGETADELMALDSTWKLLEPWLKPGDAEILRRDVYQFHSLLADRWRSGRLLIAGDAAHLMSPKLGQGLCTGMRDAVNLAWKLARVVRGAAPDSLLDSYELERKPPAQQYVEISAFMVGEILGHARSGAAAPAIEVEQIVLQRQKMGPDVTRVDDALVGTLSRQPFLADGRHLDEAVGYRFALLVSPAAHAVIDDAVRSDLAALDTAVIVAEHDSVADYLADMGREAILIRPDRYVAGSAVEAHEVPHLVAAVSAAFTEVS